MVRGFSDVDFVDTTHGWAVGTGVLRTADGGLTWQELEAPRADLLSVDFLDQKEGWVAGGEGFVFHTRDGGDTWVREPVAVLGNVVAIELLDRAHGVAVGYSDAGEKILLGYGDGPTLTDIASSP